MFRGNISELRGAKARGGQAARWHWDVSRSGRITGGDGKPTKGLEIRAAVEAIS